MQAENACERMSSLGCGVIMCFVIYDEGDLYPQTQLYNIAPVGKLVPVFLEVYILEMLNTSGADLESWYFNDFL